MIILLHTSKTMASPGMKDVSFRRPLLWEKTQALYEVLKSLSVEEISKRMKVSSTLAQKTYALIGSWSPSPEKQSLAIDSFIGDIYSGLRAEELSKKDRDYADGHLFILSGLYGILRSYDGIFPYRLEMGYKIKGQDFKDLYEFWQGSIAECLPKSGSIINLASEEFSKTIIPFLEDERIITPQFLTVNPKISKPSFVAVHAKIARGAFARFLIMNKIKEMNRLSEFTDLGYQWNKSLSTEKNPTFVCEEFGGKGLSIKLKGNT